MKILSRDFTPKEKVMLLILGLLLVLLAYYRFLWVPCADAVEAAHARRDDLQTELLTARVKEGRLKKMQEELDSLGQLELTSRIGSYNNSKAELSLLNGVLETANSYSITFAAVTRDGDQIRRNFSLQFSVDTFAQAGEIIRRLTESEYRCLLGDMNYSTTLHRTLPKGSSAVLQWVDGAAYYSQVTVNATATFFETMYDGTPDAGLPAEESR